LSTKGGLVWLKARNNAYQHGLFDTARGASKGLVSNTTDPEATFTSLTSFNTNGFSLGSDYNGGATYASWTFRKQPKFFDVVTWVGTGGVRNLAHNLGSVPGSIFVKKMVGAPQSWAVYHRSLGATEGLALDLPNVAQTWSGYWNNTEPTSTQFTVGGGFNAVDVDYPGTAYVAYLFAHDAGGFGLTGTDNVISCGTFTPSSGEATVNLGYEPQWILWKSTTTSAGWQMYDTMRGLPTGGDGDARLFANTSGAETVSTFGNLCDVTPTGFNVFQQSSTIPYIYIAIRKGPMKVPTSGTSVFDISTVSTSAGPVPGPTPTDMTINKPSYDVSTNDWRALDRLRGGGLSLFPNLSAAESAENYVYFDYQSGLRLSSWPVNTTIWYNFKRAPSFFDAVCYTGTGSATTQTHNLGAVPELVIWKRRSSTSDWRVWQSSFSVNDGVYLNSTLAKDTDPNVQTAIPTATVLNLATGAYTNASGSTYVAYLFATCAGVSKVGSYTGNGSTQTINCGFGAGGARFVLIKRTDSTSGWYFYDTARGMTTLTDPYLFINSDAGEVATLGSVTTVSTGFALNSTILAAINVSAGTYIFLAIA
jgi:hypothetical protein